MNTPEAGWSTDRLKDIAAINSVSLSADTDPTYEFDYLEISNVDYGGIIDRRAIERTTFADAPSRARRRLKAGCTIVSSVRPNLQAIAFIDEDLKDVICSTGFYVVEPELSKISPLF